MFGILVIHEGCLFEELLRSQYCRIYYD